MNDSNSIQQWSQLVKPRSTFYLNFMHWWIWRIEFILSLPFFSSHVTEPWRSLLADHKRWARHCGECSLLMVLHTYNTYIVCFRISFLYMILFCHESFCVTNAGVMQRVSHSKQKKSETLIKILCLLKWWHFHPLVTPRIIDFKELPETGSSTLDKSVKVRINLYWGENNSYFLSPSFNSDTNLNSDRKNLKFLIRANLIGRA